MQLSYGSLNKIAGSKRCIRNVPLFVPLVNIEQRWVVGSDNHPSYVRSSFQML
jgi:hypothetical protein